LEYALSRTKTYEKGIPTKEDEIVSIEYAGIEDVYDIEMADPAHNFITDSGLVTSNSHSQAYAIIGFLTAKQKAYHPAEFFAGLCNSYLGQSSYVKDDADEIISDMLRMGVKLAPFNFRRDHRRCWVNSDGQLEYAVPLIRDCSDGVAQYLYNIRDNQYDKFWKLVFDLNSSCINQSQTEILIQLGFFNEFGPGRKLWQIFAVCQFLKFGAAKKISKEKLDTGQFLYPIVERNAKGVNDKGVELKGFQITDMESILNEAEESIMASECEDFSFQEMIKAQQHYLGFISMNTGKEEDRRYVYVKAVRPAFAKKTGRQFGTHVITRSIGSGKESLLTIMSRDWKDEVVAGDILYLDHWTRTDRGYFNLDKYRVVL
jgi:DNA polymerase III alpha subunit